MLIILISYAISIANAFSISFMVNDGNKYIRILDLNEGDEVSGRISVLGIKENSINFSIFDPYSNCIQRYQNTGLQDFNFQVEINGEYKLEFDNSYSAEPKQVTLNYDVKHYILGFPQEYILLFVIVGLAMGAIIVFVALSPKP